MHHPKYIKTNNDKLHVCNKLISFNYSKYKFSLLPLRPLIQWFEYRLRQENDGTIDAAPQFMMRLRNRRVQMCYPVRLTCQVIGHPTLTVVWLKDGKVIEEDRKINIKVSYCSYYRIFSS